MDTNTHNQLSARDIMGIVANYYGISRASISSKRVQTSKFSKLPKARRVCMKLFVDLLGMTQTMAASSIGRTREMASRAMKCEIPVDILKEISSMGGKETLCQ